MLALLLLWASRLSHRPSRLTRERLHLRDVAAFEGLHSAVVRLLDGLKLRRMLARRVLFLLHVPVR